MGWGIADSEANLQFVNYNHRLDLEDGRIAFWEIEDWEIYGPDAGDNSFGPFGAWRDDLTSWFQNHVMDGRDILRWNAGSTHNGPNRNDFLALTPSLCQNICCFMSGPRITMVNGVVGFGAARPYNGASNPQLGQGGIMPGDIVVTGSRWHNDQSMTYRYRAFDPYGADYADFVENYDFLSVAVAESDVLAGVTADYSHLGGPPTQELRDAFEVMKAQIEAIISNMRLLNPASFFGVSYRDDGGTIRNGRIRVSELIMWFSRIDFEFYPAMHPFGNNGVGQTYVTNRSSMRSADVTLRVDEAAFRGWAFSNTADGTRVTNYGQITWYLIHEIVHATAFGDTLRGRYGNGLRLERLVNSYSLGLSRTIAPAFATSQPTRTAIENERQSVEGYVTVRRPDPDTGAVYDLSPPPDAMTTFSTPTS